MTAYISSGNQYIFQIPEKKNRVNAFHSRRTLPFPYAMIMLVMNLLYYSRTILETDLVCKSHLSDGCFAHAVEELVEGGEMYFCQGLLKGYAQLVEIVRKLGGMNIALSIVVHDINHLYLSFRFYSVKPTVQTLPNNCC